MPSHIRQFFLLYKVQCRVTLDSLFLPGLMSSCTQQPFCTRSNVESHSTALSSVPVPVSSYTRQPFCTKSNVELYSTALFSTRSNVELKSTRYLMCHVLRSSKLLRSNGCFWNPNINRFSEKIWTRLSELTVTSWTAKWRSCWSSQNLDAERGNEECGILSHRNQYKYPKTQCR
jgi:hypothetical protein